jgi:hypothetical protein
VAREEDEIDEYGVVKTEYENVRRLDDEKKNLGSPLQHSIRMVAKNTIFGYNIHEYGQTK